VALAEGVTNRLQRGVTPERPRPGRGLGAVAPLLGKAPHPAGGQHRQLGVRRVVADRLPVGQLGGAGGHHPPVRDLADQLGRGRAQQAPAVRAAHRELHRHWRRPRSMPSQGLGQRGQLGVGQRILGDDQQVDVAAAREVVVEGQGAVQDYPGDGLPERLGAGARHRLGEAQRLGGGGGGAGWTTGRHAGSLRLAEGWRHPTSEGCGTDRARVPVGEAAWVGRAAVMAARRRRGTAGPRPCCRRPRRPPEPLGRPARPGRASRGRAPGSPPGWRYVALSGRRPAARQARPARRQPPSRRPAPPAPRRAATARRPRSRRPGPPRGTAGSRRWRPGRRAAGWAG
jgi:hypothetical protein